MNSGHTYRSIVHQFAEVMKVRMVAIGIISSRIPFRPRQVNVLASTIAISVDNSF